DMVLGSYYLTKIHDNARGAGKVFSSRNEAMFAFDADVIALNAPITIYERGVKLETSLGRIIFNEVLPPEFGFLNKAFNKKELIALSSRIIKQFGTAGAPDYLDAIKRIGFSYAAHSGITWGIDDLIVPKEKDGIIEEAEAAVVAIRGQYQEGLLTESERRARVISIWTEVKNKIAKLVPKALNPYGSIYSIVDSGARGSWAQITQVTGMKGLVQNSRSETIELPIKSSFREGFDVLEFFIATHGARKGTTDTALKTAAAGYLTRRLVDVAQDLVIREDDCRTKEGIEVRRSDGAEYGHNFKDRLFSRTALNDIKDGKKILVAEGDVIESEVAETIQASAIETVVIRSPITCKTLYGICSKCYGLDLGRNKQIAKGEAVGVVAAQSI
ncbi:MAG: DNA-directed RNA polymerase subunit beta', partial [Patescibacteria group bacterium]